MFKGSFRQNLDPLVEYNIEDMWSAIIKSGIVEKVQPQRSNRFENEDEDDIDMNEDISEEIKDWDEDWEKASWSMRLFMDTFIGRPKAEKPLIANKSVRRHGLRRHAGNSFSEGQQQLFGLCRLLMRNRRIVVLDEATASVDLETDRQVHSLIQSEFKDCTVLTIAHRLETIMRSDRVIVMDGGRIVEVGPPAELLASNGHFSELVKANDFGQ
ncbi:Transporter of the ATP-binding cassette (ABC) [Coemansia sp. RSA 1939]|nr:Transporter of the ATP-binding cassette (ABC) [Coemansia sp. RSA 1939]KAJ2595394.1 Transporter of the ATP-binding cassette (ABC) [Coemansia sp. RSA 1804]